jgi:integrase
MSDRTKGNGAIEQRSPGSFRLRYNGPSDAVGKRKQITETLRGSRRDAERLLRERLSTVENGSYITPEKQTVGQFLAKWLDTYAATNVTPKTVQGYRQIISCYASPLAHHHIQALTARHIQGVYSSMLDRGLSANTVDHLHKVLHRALATGVKWGILVRNVSDAATAPRIVRKELKMWDVATIQRFLETAKTSRYRDFFHVAVLTGMRRSEIAGLQWANVDLVNGRIGVVKTLQRIMGKGLVVGQPKTARSRRSIALSPDTIALFHEIRGRQIGRQTDAAEIWQNTGYVFTQADGRSVDPDAITKDFANLVKSASLPHLTVHGLRHAHATLLLESGVNPKVVSERLGHATIATTMDIYSHVLPGIQEAAALALDAKLAEHG